MAEKGKRCEETAGLQWFELNNEVHTFVVHNQNHPQMIEIHAELKRLSGLIHDAVYVPSMKFVLNKVEEDEKVVHLCHHSEKTDYCIHTDQHSSLYSTPKI
jgi:DNA-binding GntR family transcriptional regulator